MDRAALRVRAGGDPERVPRSLAQEHDVYGSEQLQSVDTATTVRIESGRTIVTDAESVWPDIGGLYLLEAEDIDCALELAERIPAARLGGAVEIRPIVERGPADEVVAVGATPT